MYNISWGYALDLIYSGNIKSAKTYIDYAWVENNEFNSKKEFWNEMMDKIKESIYYGDMKNYLGLFYIN